MLSGDGMGALLQFGNSEPSPADGWLHIFFGAVTFSGAAAINAIMYGTDTLNEDLEVRAYPCFIVDEERTRICAGAWTCVRCKDLHRQDMPIRHGVYPHCF